MPVLREAVSGQAWCTNLAVGGGSRHLGLWVGGDEV